MKIRSLCIPVTILIILLLSPLVQALTLVDTQPFEYKEVNASDIVKQIEVGQDVHYEHCRILGELNASNMKLPNVSTRSTSYEKSSAGVTDIILLGEDSPVIKSNITIFDSIFENNVDFSGVTFNGSAVFSYSTFNGSSDFSGATFNDSSDFIGATFNNYSYFTGATFKSSIYFDIAKFNNIADFNETNFNSSPSFYGVAFFNNAYFLGTIFNNDVKGENMPDSSQNIFTDGKTCEIFRKGFNDEAEYTDADNIYYNFRTTLMNSEFMSISKVIDFLSWITCGFGTKLEFTIGWIVGIMFAFAFVYFIPYTKSMVVGVKNKVEPDIDYYKEYGIYRSSEEHKKEKTKVSFWECLGFSINTFTRLGSPNWSQRDKFWIAVTIEGLLGWVMLAIFLATLMHLLIRP